MSRGDVIPGLVEASFHHEGTIKSIEGFEKDWKHAYEMLDFKK
ncbi:hypothetical protein [Sinobaca sp. H24]|nr:hypothetical protein [Sinobaca sp. H24]